jgi:hypothetical protein
MKYTPETILATDLAGLIEYLQREFVRISDTLERPETTALNYGKEVINTGTNVNWKSGQKQRLELGSTSSITFVAPEGVCNLMLRVVYSGSYTPTFPSTVKWQSGTVPTWSAASGKVDVIAMYFDGTNYHATASLDSK